MKRGPKNGNQQVQEDQYFEQCDTPEYIKKRELTLSRFKATTTAATDKI